MTNRARSGSSAGPFLGLKILSQVQGKAKALDYWIDVF